jgi:hypothetical protein
MYDAQSGKFCDGGAPISYKCMLLLFGISGDLLRAIKGTNHARAPSHPERGTSVTWKTKSGKVFPTPITVDIFKAFKFPILSDIFLTEWMVNKEDIIVAFLKEVSKIYDPQPDKIEVHIPYGFKRGLYQTFLEFWIHEVEGGINGKVTMNIFVFFHVEPSRRMELY